VDWSSAAEVVTVAVSCLAAGSCAAALTARLSLTGSSARPDQARRSAPANPPASAQPRQPAQPAQLAQPGDQTGWPRPADLIPFVGWLRRRRRFRGEHSDDRGDPGGPGGFNDAGDPGDLGARRQAEPGAWDLAAELIAAAAAAGVWLRFGLSPQLPALGYLVVAGVALALIDARTRRLPDALTLPSYPVALVLLGLAALWLPDGAGHLVRGLAGLAIAWLFFVLQALIYPAGVGWGDVKLSGVLGLYLGWFGTSALLAGLLGGYLLAALTGTGLLLAGRATRKSLLPFGPFLLASTMTVILVAGPRLS
jgi:Flp pilus assembly protein protease CpaA